jgi:hypothetical protein
MSDAGMSLLPEDFNDIGMPESLDRPQADVIEMREQE